MTSPRTRQREFCNLICKSREKRGPPIAFRDPGFGLFEDRESGFCRKGGARFGIVLVNGIRDLAVLGWQIREMLLERTGIR